MKARIVPIYFKSASDPEFTAQLTTLKQLLIDEALLQMIFNALWSPLFFGLRSPALALVDILLLWLALLRTIVACWRARPIAGAMLVPYLAWVSFATALNFALWHLNS